MQGAHAWESPAHLPYCNLHAIYLPYRDWQWQVVRAQPPLLVHYKTDRTKQTNDDGCLLALSNQTRSSHAPKHSSNPRRRTPLSHLSSRSAAQGKQLSAVSAIKANAGYGSHVQGGLCEIDPVLVSPVSSPCFCDLDLAQTALRIVIHDERSRVEIPSLLQPQHLPASYLSWQPSRQTARAQHSRPRHPPPS